MAWDHAAGWIAFQVTTLTNMMMIRRVFESRNRINLHPRKFSILALNQIAVVWDYLLMLQRLQDQRQSDDLIQDEKYCRDVEVLTVADS